MTALSTWWKKGLLAAAKSPNAHRTFYRPTKKGAAMVDTLQLAKTASVG
jgi:hypothetical protein